MRRIVKLFNKHMYTLGGLLYLGAVAVFFIATISYATKTINNALPGGAEVFVPEVSFGIDEYKKIQDKVGVIVREITETAETVETTEITEVTQTTTTEITETEAATTEITETPEIAETAETLDKSLISISVLNGSGVSGAAANLKKELEAEGFVVDQTANTKRTQKSRLEIKDSKIAYSDLIVQVISKLYVVDEVKGLSESEEVDAIFIIGVE